MQYGVRIHCDRGIKENLTQSGLTRDGRHLVGVLGMCCDDAVARCEAALWCAVEVCYGKLWVCGRVLWRCCEGVLWTSCHLLRVRLLLRLRVVPG